MICQTSLVGDAAASMSGTIVQMLKEYRSLGATEKFIEQVLRTKLVIYSKDRAIMNSVLIHFPLFSFERTKID